MDIGAAGALDLKVRNSRMLLRIVLIVVPWRPKISHAFTNDHRCDPMFVFLPSTAGVDLASVARATSESTTRVSWISHLSFPTLGHTLGKPLIL